MIAPEPQPLQNHNVFSTISADFLSLESCAIPYQKEIQNTDIRSYSAPIKPHNLSPGMSPIALNQNTLYREDRDSQQLLEELISTAYKQDSIPSKIMEAIYKGDRQLPPDLARSKIPIAMLSEREGRLYGKRLFVPKDNALCLRLL
jgi:hypothetical protein